MSLHFSAVVVGYDSLTHSASVRGGLLGVVTLACLASCPTLLAGDVVAVVLHDASNPEDGAVLGPFGGLGQSPGAILTDSNGDVVSDSNGDVLTEG